MILDCETYGSAITSLSEIFSVPVRAIETLLRSIDLEADYDTGLIPCSPDTYLIETCKKKLNAQSKRLSEVCWFHLTRVRPDTDFTNEYCRLAQSSTTSGGC